MVLNVFRIIYSCMSLNLYISDINHSFMNVKLVKHPSSFLHYGMDAASNFWEFCTAYKDTKSVYHKYRYSQRNTEGLHYKTDGIKRGSDRGINKLLVNDCVLLFINRLILRKKKSVLIDEDSDLLLNISSTVMVSSLPVRVSSNKLDELVAIQGSRPI